MYEKFFIYAGVNIGLEKYAAHYSLTEQMKLIEEGRFKFTYSSRKTLSEEFNITIDEALRLILKLTADDLYKSMQSHEDKSLWQDVYHKKIGLKTAYIKLQVSLNGFAVIISFKQK